MSQSKVVNYIEVEYLQERFTRNGGRLISDGDMRELARKVVEGEEAKQRLRVLLPKGLRSALAKVLYFSPHMNGA